MEYNEHSFAALQPARLTPRGFQTALLTSFRRNGQGVATPVGIIVSGEKIYFATRSSTGKVKRLRHTSRVTLAPCTRRGVATGPAIAAIARRLEGDEALPVERLFFSSIWGQLWLRIYQLLRPNDHWVVYEVSPANEQGE